MERIANQRIVGYPACYHRLAPDPNCSNPEPHQRGNQLAVVFWLLADGRSGASSEYNGLNPLCQAFSSNPVLSCGSEDRVPPLGLSKASAIFFRLMTVHLDMLETEEWEKVAHKAKQAAHELYSSHGGVPCNDALAEQDAIQNAFDAIGASGSDPDWRNCSYCGCPS